MNKNSKSQITKLKQTTNHKIQEGFTLIELVVVIAIIATLTALATFNFNQARLRARDVQRKSELRQIQTALELFKNDHYPQRYPTDGEGLASLIPPTGSYMSKLPVDPKVKSLAGSWVDYTYDNITGLSYTLSTCLENTSDADKAAGSCLGGVSSRVLYQLTQ